MASTRVAVVLVGHGSRLERANEEFSELVRNVAICCPDQDVHGAFLELAAPAVEDVLTEAAHLHARALVVPVFLFAAAHLRRDLPAHVSAVRAMGWKSVVDTTGPIGDSAFIRALAADLVVASGESMAAPGEVVLVGRGSSDADVTRTFVGLAEQFSRSLSMPVQPAFLAVAEPSVDEALAAATARSARSVVVLPYLMFAGSLVAGLVDQCEHFAATHSELELCVASHLGGHERFALAIAEHVQAELVVRGWLSAGGCPRVGIRGSARD